MPPVVPSFVLKGLHLLQLQNTVSLDPHNPSLRYKPISIFMHKTGSDFDVMNVQENM